MYIDDQIQLSSSEKWITFIFVFKFIKYWIWYTHLISEMHICVNRISRQYMEYKLLGNEFYLFVSHGGMNDRGSTCKFCNAQSAFQNLHVDPLSFIPPWETNKKNWILILAMPSQSDVTSLPIWRIQKRSFFLLKYTTVQLTRNVYFISIDR